MKRRVSNLPFSSSGGGYAANTTQFLTPSETSHIAALVGAAIRVLWPDMAPNSRRRVATFDCQITNDPGVGLTLDFSLFVNGVLAAVARITGTGGTPTLTARGTMRFNQATGLAIAGSQRIGPTDDVTIAITSVAGGANPGQTDVNIEAFEGR